MMKDRIDRTSRIYRLIKKWRICIVNAAKLYLYEVFAFQPRMT